MNRHFFRLVVFSVCALTLAACKKSSTPTTPSPGTTVTAVMFVGPAANLVIPNASQPVTLVVKNATVTGNGVATYVFEVATDSAFASKIVTRSGVPQGANGQTAVTLDTLSAGDYFWRARAEAGGTPGPLSGSNKFSIAAAISVSAPTPVSPSDGAKTNRRPTFRVKNAARSGPVGAITYRFELSTSATFTTILATSTQSEGTTNTDFTPSSNLPTGTLFWRATAMDATNDISSAASAVQSVTATEPSTAEAIADQQGGSLWTGAQPPGTNGHSGGLSAGWEIGNRVSYDGQPYSNPPIEALRLFDLIDRGMDPDAAINWLASHGYPSTGQWYPEVAVIGIPHVYMALIAGQWELVHRAGG